MLEQKAKKNADKLENTDFKRSNELIGKRQNISWNEIWINHLWNHKNESDRIVRLFSKPEICSVKRKFYWFYTTLSLKDFTVIHFVKEIWPKKIYIIYLCRKLKIIFFLSHLKNFYGSFV